MARLSVAALLAVTLAPAPAVAQHWYRVYAGDELHSYVDLDSIKTTGGVIVAREMLVWPVAQSNVEFKWVETTAEYDCASKSAVFTRFKLFGADGSLIGEHDASSVGGRHTPNEDSPGYASVAFICNIDRTKAVAVANPPAEPF